MRYFNKFYEEAGENYIVRRYENGDQEWYNQAGQRHRPTGPAIEYEDGEVEYWLFGERVSRKEVEGE